jgi:hypothetical protein
MGNQIIYEPESQFLIEYGLGSTPATEMGVYVDLGCAGPVLKSLTHFCRVLGWPGLAIDANLDYANDWAAAGFGKHFVCAVLSDQPSARFVTHDNSFTSRISDLPEMDQPEKWGIKSIEVRATIPLEHLLDLHEIGKIDLLTVDLEGHELAVLKTLDWEKHSPAYVVAEFVTQGLGVDAEVGNFLISKGYTLIHMSSSNLIFRRQ